MTEPELGAVHFHHSDFFAGPPLINASPVSAVANVLSLVPLAGSGLGSTVARSQKSFAGPSLLKILTCWEVKFGRYSGCELPPGLVPVAALTKKDSMSSLKPSSITGTLTVIDAVLAGMVKGPFCWVK